MPLQASTGFVDALKQLNILLIPDGGDKDVMAQDTPFLGYIHQAA